MTAIFLYFGLTDTEMRLFSLLMSSKQVLTKESAMVALYSSGSSSRSSEEIPQDIILGVYICKIRKKVKKYNIEIVTVWGKGYMLTPESKVVLEKLNKEDLVHDE